MRTRWLTIPALAGVAALVCSNDAGALSFKDIAGKWCSDDGIYTFAEKKLVVQPAGVATKELEITSYSFTDDTVHMVWMNRTQPSSTNFSEFTADRKFMVQQKGGNSPRREFHRC